MATCLRASLGVFVCESEEEFLVSWGGCIFGGGMGSCGWLFLGNILGLNEGFVYSNIFGQEIGETDVASLGRYDGLRGGKELVMISGKRFGRRMK